MSNYSPYYVQNLSEKDTRDFVQHYNRLELLFDWTQKGKLNVNQFRQLIEIDKEETKRQIDLDSWD